MARLPGIRLGSILALACLPAASSAQTGQVPAAVRAQAANAVVQITATNCSDGGDKVGSGFVFKDSKTIVTALHVVANCSIISIWFEREAGAPTRTGQLLKALPQQDVAMIELDGNATSAQTPLVSGSGVGVGDPLSAIGYARNQQTLQDWQVALSIGTKRPPDGTSLLSEMLDSTTAQSINSGSPIAVSSTVLRLSSPLQPGMSGGPIVDQNGAVIGIVGGGLERGLAPISWGWPSNLLAALDATGQLPSNATYNFNRVLYAVSATAGTASASATCGDLTFDLVDTRRFADLAASNDDPQKTAWIASISGLGAAEVDNLEFYIWRHAESGAVVATPANAIVSTNTDGMCELSSPNHQFKQVFAGYSVSSPADIQPTSLRFEAVTTYFPHLAFAQFDPVLTAGFRFREDSLYINRKGFIWAHPGTNHFQHGFETIMSRGNSFVGIQTINEDYCAGQPRTGCMPPSNDYLKTFAHFVLATQLATYPIY